MSKLVQILGEDFMGVYNLVKGLSKGALRATYTPFFLQTACIQTGRDMVKEEMGAAEGIGILMGQACGSVFIHLPLIMKYETDYLIALGVANVVGYGYNLCKRSKKRRGEEKQLEFTFNEQKPFTTRG